MNGAMLLQHAAGVPHGGRWCLGSPVTPAQVALCLIDLKQQPSRRQKRIVQGTARLGGEAAQSAATE